MGTYSGNVLVNSGGFQAGAISQNITGLTVGHQYLLSFDWAAGQETVGGNPFSASWGVTFGSDMASTSTVNLPGQGFASWDLYQTTFTATSTSELLSFQAVSSDYFGASLLDGVSLTEVSGGGANGGATVPEPASLALMFAGLLGLSARRRARKIR